MRMIQITECHRKNLCVDCDSKTCDGAGDPGADCPAWICKRPGVECEDCDFLKEYVTVMRKAYAHDEQASGGGGRK